MHFASLSRHETFMKNHNDHLQQRKQQDMNENRHIQRERERVQRNHKIHNVNNGNKKSQFFFLSFLFQPKFDMHSYNTIVQRTTLTDDFNSSRSVVYN